jgi:hypothetical protein
MSYRSAWPQANDQCSHTHLVCDTGVEAVKDARYADKDGRPQRTDVVYQRLWGALPVADARATRKEHLFSDAAKDVCEWEVGQEDVIIPCTRPPIRQSSRMIHALPGSHGRSVRRPHAAWPLYGHAACWMSTRSCYTTACTDALPTAS